jgi:TRAP-type C4-dicarboxylate transport system substrate-binding protein
MNENMWSNFDTDTKEIFKSAAKVVARAERKQSVADAQEIASSPTIYNNHGIQDLLYFSEEEQFKLKTKLTPLIDKWKPYFTPGLVDNILAH